MEAWLDRCMMIMAPVAHPSLIVACVMASVDGVLGEGGDSALV